MKKVLVFTVILSLLVLCGCEKKVDVDVNKTEDVKFHDLTISIPIVFEKDEKNSNDGIIQYSFDDHYDDLCMLYFSFSDYPEDDIKNTITDGMLGKTDYTYSEKEINGNKWSIGYRVDSTKYSQTFYAINKNNKEYSFDYNIFGSGDDCAKALSVIENSLKFN